jgi:hypothetical protein
MQQKGYFVCKRFKFEFKFNFPTGSSIPGTKTLRLLVEKGRVESEIEKQESHVLQLQKESSGRLSPAAVHL